MPGNAISDMTKDKMDGAKAFRRAVFNALAGELDNANMHTAHLALKLGKKKQRRNSLRLKYEEMVSSVE